MEAVKVGKRGAIVVPAKFRKRFGIEGAQHVLGHANIDVTEVYAERNAQEAMRIMAARLRSTSASVVAQEETLMRIAVCPCQTVGPHQQVPSR